MLKKVLLSFLVSSFVYWVVIDNSYSCSGLNGTTSGFISQPSQRAKAFPRIDAYTQAALSDTEYVMVIQVHFSDRNSTVTDSSWYNELFPATSFTMRDYYEEVSYGKLILLPYSCGSSPCTVSCNPACVYPGILGSFSLQWWNVYQNRYETVHPDSVHGSSWLATNPQDSRWIARAAVDSADNYVDFSIFDFNQDGYISARELHIVVVVAGFEASFGFCGSQFLTWRHHWNLDNGIVVDGDTILQYSIPGSGDQGGYSMVGELDCTKTPDNNIEFGLIAHELGHDMGLPDLYDVNGGSEGVGEWSLMGTGDWLFSITNNHYGGTPAHFDAWSKIELGFISPNALSCDIRFQKIPRVEDNPVIYKLQSTNMAATEYFLVENRRRVLYDRGLVFQFPAEGVLIWHIDEQIINTKLVSNLVNADETHKGVDVECADQVNPGHSNNADDLDFSVNRGDATDPWYSGNEIYFGKTSAPSSISYSGLATDVEVDSISAIADTMSANLKVGVKRGDATGDDNISTGDIVFLINYFFKQGSAPSPVCRGDVNCDGGISAGDIVYLINFYFKAGPPPC